MFPIPAGRFPTRTALLSLLAVTAAPGPREAAAASAASTASATSATAQAYVKATEDFINPERGFYYPAENFSRESLREIRRVHKASVIRTYFRLDAYRNSPLPAAFLQKVGSDLGLVREAGLKCIVRFAYNFGLEEPDAPLDRILAHIDQLAPVLTADVDVVALLEAGFIGAWGEWHGSANGLDTDKNRKAVLLKLLSVLPPERMVAVRCNIYKRGALGSDQPLGPEEAYDGSPRARVGAHNDCLGASKTDFGTYSDKSVEAEKTFLSLDNRFVPQEGETCNPGTYAQCSAMLQDLRRMRWDLLNLGYHPDVIRDWKQQGCFPEIQSRLGYRFVLLRSSIQDSVRPGSGLRVSLTLANEGWGKAFNARGLELVLREERTKARHVLALPGDPRRWGPGDSATLEVMGGIPAGMPAGRYQAFLNLPDPMQRLHNRPEYSIRLANAGLWEDSTGLNALRHTVVVSGSAPGTAHEGPFFQPEGVQAPVAVRRADRASSLRKQAMIGKLFGSRVYDLRGRTYP